MTLPDIAIPLLEERTIKYKTYLKRAFVEALTEVFRLHPDTFYRNVKVTLDFPFTRNAYPAVIVRFFERTVRNAGVGHIEWIQGAIPAQPEAFTEAKHSLYDGTVEFAVHGLSSLDRDQIADSIVHIVRHGSIEAWANGFVARFYNTDLTDDPYSLYHYINVNTDELQGFGETQNVAPWQPEDVMVYQTAYRMPVFGELYSRPPEQPYGLIEDVDVYPYIKGIEEVPQGANDPARWISDEWGASPF